MRSSAFSPSSKQAVLEIFVFQGSQIFSFACPPYFLASFCGFTLGPLDLVPPCLLGKVRKLPQASLSLTSGYVCDMYVRLCACRYIRF